MFGNTQQIGDFLVRLVLEDIQVEYGTIPVGQFTDELHQYLLGNLADSHILVVGAVGNLLHQHLLLKLVAPFPQEAQGLIYNHS